MVGSREQLKGLSQMRVPLQPNLLGDVARVIQPIEVASMAPDDSFQRKPHGERRYTTLSYLIIQVKVQFFDILFTNHRKRSIVQNLSNDTTRHGTTQHDTTRDGAGKATTPRNPSALRGRNTAASWGRSFNWKRTLDTERLRAFQNTAAAGSSARALHKKI